MGLFDGIKDAFTTDDDERREAAKKEAERAQAELDKVKKDVGADDKADADRVKKAEQAAADARAKEAGLAPKTGNKPKAEAAAQEKKAAPAPAPTPAPAPAAPPAAPQQRTYTVVPGDSLSAIGERFGVSWREIASLNNVANPDLIHPGQVFKIPNS